MRYSEPRFTKDLDIWVGHAPHNARRVFATSISGCVFEEAWQRRVPGAMYGAPVHFIALSDLITNKRAAGRASDLEQLNLLNEE